MPDAAFDEARPESGHILMPLNLHEKVDQPTLREVARVRIVRLHLAQRGLRLRVEAQRLQSFRFFEQLGCI